MDGKAVRGTAAWILSASAIACGGAPTPRAPGDGGEPGAVTTFAADVAFLEAHDAGVVVLAAPSGARVAVSARYQGRVMTSAVAEDGASFGWIHRRFVASGQVGTPFDNFGGEDRLWIGPEAGQYGFYFPKGSAFTFDAWQVPHALQEGTWETREASAERVVFAREMKLTSWSGASFSLAVTRTISMLGEDDVGVPIGSAELVAFQSHNRLTNNSGSAWTRDTGLPSIWVLAQYAPSPDAHVIVPFETAGTGPIVNDAYFGKVPADRLVVREAEGALFFAADGKARGKIGLGPLRAKPRLGSYSRAARMLTVVSYDGPRRGAPYVNSMWEQQREPYGGDVVNAYNDGSPAPGKPPLGGFYEIETSSPGAELAPGASLAHVHRTFHFVGDEDVLEPIAKALLGVSLSSVPR